MKRLLPTIVLLVAAMPTVGVTAQTVLQSTNNSNPLFGNEFVVNNGRIWFSALGTVEGAEVWSTDGTAAGTEVGAEIVPGYTNDHPEELTPVGDKIFFFFDGDNDWELWMTNGTQNGTMRILEKAYPAFSDDNPILTGVAKAGERAVAFADGWMIAVDPANGDTTHLRPANSVGFVQAETFAFAFSQHPTTLASELIRTDGTRQGTEVLSNIMFSKEDLIGLAGNRLVFIADEFLGQGEEIYVSDGTPGGSGFFDEFIVGNEDIACTDMTTGDGVVYIALKEPGANACKPYVSDGTPGGTQPIVDFTAPLIHGISAAHGLIYFWDSAVNLWRTDGTVDGTFQVGTLQGTGTPVVEFDNAAWFGGFVGGRYTLWTSNGTVGGTQEFFAGDATTIDPRSLRAIGSRLYFSGLSTYYLEDTSTGVEDLFASNEIELQVYPNPFADHLTVSLRTESGADARVGGGLSDNVSIVVYDLLGRRVPVQQTTAATDASQLDLELPDLSPGIYVVRVTAGTRVGQQTVIRR